MKYDESNWTLYNELGMHLVVMSFTANRCAEVVMSSYFQTFKFNWINLGISKLVLQSNSQDYPIDTETLFGQ